MTKENVSLVIKNAGELIMLSRGSQKPLLRQGIRRLEVVKNGCIAIKYDRIVVAGKTEELERRFKGEETIDATGKVVMPGFVDPHTHLVFAGSREEEFESRLQGASYLEILTKGGGILKTVRETRKASKGQLVEAGKKTLDIMLKHGTTTVEAKSGYGLTTKDEIKCLEAAKELNKTHPVDVVPTFLGAHAVPPEYKGKTSDYVGLVVEEMIPKVAAKGLAKFCDVFCERGVFDIEQSRRVLQTGRRYALKPKVHADELTSFGGAELAAETRAVSAEHLLFASERGLKAMAKERVVAVLLPAASFSLMAGKYADAQRMIQLGVPVALGTDFNPSCWTENMQMAISFACREMHLTPAEAIIAATINAAHAVGCAQEVGSLESGKKADIVILDVPSHKFLGYRFGVNLVDKVVKEGKLVVDNGEE